MIVVARMYQHMLPCVVEVFEKCDNQSRKDAEELAKILARKNDCEYKVFTDITCAYSI